MPARLRAGTTGAAIALAVLLSYALAAAAPDVELFTREGCPRCADAERHFAALAASDPSLVIAIADVGHDVRARARLTELAASRGAAAASVPAMLVRGTLVVGWSEPATGERIAALLAGEPPAGGAPGETCSADPAVSCTPDGTHTGLELPLLGRVDVGDLGLPLFTIAVGLVDGFNPCAMWVLLLLLALLVNVQSRARMALVAGIFVAVSGAVYFAFMAAWLNAFLLLGISRAIQVVLGVTAVAVGLVHVKDFAAPGRGVSLSIPARAKPGLYARMRAIVHAEHLFSALVATTVLAILVNAIELLCTAGLPALYTGVLATQGVSPLGRYGWLALYVAAYVLDDAVMVTVAVVTLGHGKLQDRAGRWLKLVSGSAIILLGAILLLRPQWLVWR